MSQPVNVRDDQIVVVASTDDNYAYPLGVMFVSLLENTACPESVALFIIDGGISQIKKDHLIRTIASYNASLTFLDVNSELYADFPTVAQISAPAYYRISIPDLFGSSVKRAIYLDCDLIVQSDVTDLWQADLEGQAIAAIENISSSTYRQSGLAQEDYFNSGVMVIDLDYWRAHGLPEKIRAFKVEHPELICTNDQCALNGVLRGQWKRLPIRWNHQSGLYRNSEQIKRLKHQNEWEAAVFSPSIIHYVGWAKPWITPCHHPLRQHFFHYQGVSGLPMTRVTSPFAGSILNPRRHMTQLKKYLRKRKWQKQYRQRGIVLY
ncbi:glycosyltransferase family 8 protein [bacterium]|nr:glycosyltransferase family 8 protein [bacterium]